MKTPIILTMEPENDIPIENLRKQLGFAKRSDFCSGRFKFPLLRNVCKSTLWGNRNVLEVSCHIDNMLALCAGEQISFMAKHMPWMDEKCLLESRWLPPKDLHANKGDGSDADNISIERWRFLCQMAIVNPEDAHLDKSATFLGCSMEMLRSSLAKWAENEEHRNESVWKPSLDGETLFDTGDCSIQFKASDDLTECLRTLKCVSNLTERYIQMRILWELQNHFQSNLADVGVAPNSLEAIALCVLSFPAVSMDVRESRRFGGKSRIKEGKQHCVLTLEISDDYKFQIDDYEYAIRASCGPQDVFIMVSFTTEDESDNLLLSVGIFLDSERRIRTFEWEVWRDSFYGRLEGYRRVQEQLGTASLPLLRTQNDISAVIEKTQRETFMGGSAMNVWKGWLPPRASICKYEITTAGFIMQSAQTRSIFIQVPVSNTLTVTLTVPREVWTHVFIQGMQTMYH